mgnify:CR=1 FL=1
MSAVDLIKKNIALELNQFDSFFKSEIKSQTYLLDLITKYILRSKGKQMRPMLVFLSAKLNGEINQSSYSAAFLIELMHTATLVHDDVVDDSMKRRGLFSINALWKNKVAVLVGDFFLAKGLLHSVKNKEFDLLEIVSEAVKEMSEGELLQTEKARLLNITEDIYFEIIKKKTASLIAAAMMAGAKSVNANEIQLETMHKIGILIGLAFQIRDDILDYELTNVIGKPTGNDIKERKMTLPLIHVYSKANKEDKQWIMSVLKRHNTDSQKVKSLVEYVKKNGGIDYSVQKMTELKNEAISLLSIYREDEIKDSFILLINYITERKK